MKRFIIFLLFFFSISICYSQNSYKKREFEKIIKNIDKDSMLNIISLSDTINNKKFTFTQYYKGHTLVKIELRLNYYLEDFTETYYYDKNGYCIYCIVKENKYGLEVSKLEIKYYGENKLRFFKNDKEIYYNKAQRQAVLEAISIDLNFYKEYFK